VTCLTQAVAGADLAIDRLPGYLDRPAGVVARTTDKGKLLKNGARQVVRICA
jgi:hypothetical protein